MGCDFISAAITVHINVKGSLTWPISEALGSEHPQSVVTGIIKARYLPFHDMSQHPPPSPHTAHRIPCRPYRLKILENP